MFRRLDDDALRNRFCGAKPFPHIVLDDFVQPDALAALVRDLPDYATARQLGTEFSSPYEKRKVQVTDPDRFAPAVRRLHEELASDDFRAQLTYLTNIFHLRADPGLAGGGIHETDGGGRLDVHIDFNYLPDVGFRRLNLLLFLNEGWQREWGGTLELWNEDVSECVVEVVPVLNRCVIFATSEHSYHGVTEVAAPEGHTRKSFSAYYYTLMAPPGWTDDFHGTLFKPRPGEEKREFGIHAR